MRQKLSSERRAELVKKRRAQLRDARSAMEREVSAAKREAGLKYVSTGRSVDVQARSLMALIPPDTRDLTARIFGDPLPGRSALAQRLAKEA